MTTREAILDYLGAQHRRDVHIGSTLNAIQKGAKLRLGACPPIAEVAGVIGALQTERRIVELPSWHLGPKYRLRVVGDS